jgi:hypothetical protein
MTNAINECPELVVAKRGSKFVCRLLAMAVKGEAVEYF